MTDPSAAPSELEPRPFTCARTDGFFGSTWIDMTGELDLAGAPQLDETLRQAQLDAPLVVLDLRDLAFMDCAGMHVIVDAARRARREGDRLVVVRGGPQVDLVFRLTKSSRLLEMVDLDPAEPRDEALRRLAHEAVPPRALPPDNGASGNASAVVSDPR